MAEGPRFSLVVASLGREAELWALFDSLLQQAPVPFEVILVDQNADDRLAAVVAAFAGRMALRRVTAPVVNSSFARNAGLVHCRGEFVGFPDDDCVYPAGVLAAVAREFDADARLGVVTGAAAAPGGGLGSGRWHATRAAITRGNAFTTVICFNLFLRRDLLMRLGGFDEALGVGAVWGACEENDLVLRALASGAAGLYDPALLVVHPDKRLTLAAAARAYRYGAGFGYVLRKHGFGLAVIGRFALRSMGGVVVGLLRGNGLAARYYWETLRGRMAGYCASRNRART